MHLLTCLLTVWQKLLMSLLRFQKRKYWYKQVILNISLSMPRL